MIHVSTGGKNYFDANNQRYRSCCCHVKTFVWVLTVVQLVSTLLGFVNVGMMGAFCDPEYLDQLERQLRNLTFDDDVHDDGHRALWNATATNMTGPDDDTDDPLSVIRLWEYYRQFLELMCAARVFYLVLYVFNLVILVLAVCGLLKENWRLLAPEVVYSGVGMAVGTIMVVVLMLLTLFVVHVLVFVIMLVFYVPFLALFWYIWFLELRCAQFFKEKEDYYNSPQTYNGGGEGAPVNNTYPPSTYNNGAGPLPPIRSAAPPYASYSVR